MGGYGIIGSILLYQQEELEGMEDAFLVGDVGLHEIVVAKFDSVGD